MILSCIHCKKRLAIFLSPAGMPLTKLSLAGKNYIILSQGEFGYDIPAGEGKIAKLFFTVYHDWKLWELFSYRVCSILEIGQSKHFCTGY